YRWSTHAHHAGVPTRSSVHLDLWTPTDWFLALAKDPCRRGERYLRAYDVYLRNAVEPEYVDELKILEAISQTYVLRLRRPDGSLAAEDIAPYDVGGHLPKISE